MITQIKYYIFTLIFLLSLCVYCHYEAFAEEVVSKSAAPEKNEVVKSESNGNNEKKAKSQPIPVIDVTSHSPKSENVKKNEIELAERNIFFKGEKRNKVLLSHTDESEKDISEAEKAAQKDEINQKLNQSYLKKIEPEIVSYSKRISPISADGNEYLLNLWPKSKKGIDPFVSNLVPSKIIADTKLEKLSIKPGFTDVELYKKLVKSLDGPDISQSVEKLLLRANLYLILADNGYKKYYTNAFKDYSFIYKKYSDSPYVMDAIYNVAYLLLKSGRFLESIEIANKNENKWSKDKLWTDKFRSLIMEVYYDRNRYIKTEDYLWLLASKIEKSELTQHLALRYSDALFWQKKYISMIEWYKNENVANYFDDSKPWVQISHLYLAEAFFQMHKYDEALKRFSQFQQSYAGKIKKEMLDFRILQCEMMLSGDYNKYIPIFYNFALKIDSGIIQDAARVQWARLISREAANGEAVISQAHAITTGLLTQITDLQLIKETVFVKALLTYRLGEYKKALDTVAKIYPRRFIKTLDAPFLKSVANFAVVLLEHVAPEMWKKNQTIDYLVLADRFTYAIQNANNKSSLLFWVGRAYVENGMTGSAVHIFEKLLKDMNVPNKTRTALELAKAYGLMGNTEAMGRALSLVKDIPEPADEKALYYLTRATYQMTTKNYAACAEDLDQLLIRGVNGDELFHFALEGAICARKAKQFDRALKLIALLDTANDNLLDSSLPKNLQELHQRGLFEKVSILAETQKYSEAVESFLKIKASDEQNLIEPPLETIFLVVDCLRKLEKPDEALNIWKQYASQTKSLPKGFGDQFTRLLELLASTELVPLANQQAPEDLK